MHSVDNLKHSAAALNGREKLLNGNGIVKNEDVDMSDDDDVPLVCF